MYMQILFSEDDFTCWILAKTALKVLVTKETLLFSLGHAARASSVEAFTSRSNPTACDYWRARGNPEIPRFPVRPRAISGRVVLVQNKKRPSRPACRRQL